MKIKKRLRLEVLLALYGISAFLLNSVLRNSIMYYFRYSVPDVNYSCIGILFIGAVTVLRSRSVKAKKVYLLFVIAMYSFSVFTSNIFSLNLTGISVLFFSILPGFLVILFDRGKFDYIKVLEIFRTCFNSVIIVILTLGIVDYFIGGILNTILATKFSSSDWARMIISENLTFGFRMCTILGSPLMNAFFALVFIAINNIYGLYFKKNKPWILFSDIFGIISIVLTGSRTAFILSVALVFISVLNGTKNIKRLIIIIFSFLAIIVGVNSTIFQDTIGVRFNNDLLSDGRFSMLNAVLNGEYGDIHFLYSEGYNYSRHLTATGVAATQNFEIPILMFLFDYGVLATSIYYFIFLGLPMYRMFKSKNYYILSCYIILFLHLNSFNCLAQKYDFNMMLGFLLVVFINLKPIPKRRIE